MSLPPQGSSHPTEEKSYSKTSISLIRTGSPVQINITGYDIYFGTTINPHLYKSGYNGTSLADISISPNTTY